MKKRFLLPAVLVLTLASAYGQVVNSPAITPAAPTTSAPKPEVLTPKAAAPVTSDMIIAPLTVLYLQASNMMLQYTSELKDLQAKYTGPANTIQAAIDAKVAEIKKANGWGDDVTFNSQTGKFMRNDTASQKAAAHQR